jgi:ATP-dependent Clp protease ATP-binding subunit ClpC
MPKINVYLSDELAAAVKDAGIPVSPICQQALELAVRKVAATREVAAKMDFTNDADPMAHLTNFTAKARKALHDAVAMARRNGQEQVGTEHVLAGVLGAGENLAIQVLLSLDIDPDAIRDDLAARMAAATGEALADDDLGVRHLGPAAAAVLKGALAEAITMGHNYIGCEHLLLALVADQEGTGGEVVRSHGAELRLVRRAVQAAISGYAFARSRGDASGEHAGAAQLRQVLGQFGERLDRIEARIAQLPEG